MTTNNVLWWGRSDNHYSRNSIIRQHFNNLGWEITDFSPSFSFSASLEARLKRIKHFDLVWVPCFRQRDLASASKWSKKHHIPLIFDPLISAYDKQVYERQKFTPDSTQAKTLLQWEKSLFQQADLIIADTSAHAEYFNQQLGIPRQKIRIIYVGADETVFSPIQPEKYRKPKENKVLDILFYGSFIPLQGPQIIIGAAAATQGKPVHWTLVGKGPLLDSCQQQANHLNLNNVNFTEWLDYQTALPERIDQADILLGIFGDTPKAGRVIPNKVFQSMAMGKPIITQSSKAYPEQVRQSKGIVWVNPGQPQALADAALSLSQKKEKLADLGASNYQIYKACLSDNIISRQLEKAVQSII